MIGVVRTVHAHVPKVERIGCWECALCHERGDHGDLQRLCDREQLLFGVRSDDAATDVEDRALRFLHHVHGLADLARIALHRWLVGRNVHIGRIVELDLHATQI